MELQRDGQRHRKLGTVAGAFVGLAAGYPSSFGATITVFIVPLSLAFAWERTVPFGIYVSSMVGMALASFVLGRLVERYGETAIAMSGGIGLALGMAGLSQMSGSIPLALALGLGIGVVGAGTGVGVYISALPKRFDTHLGRALGVAVLGQSLGMALMPVLAASVTASSGWRTAYLALAACQLVLTAAAVLLLRCAGTAEPASRPAFAAPAPEEATFSEAVRTPRFWLLALAIFFGTLGVIGAAVLLFPIAIDRGIAGALLAGMAAALGIGTAVGRLGAGLLLDRLDARRVAAGTFVLGAAGIIGLTTLSPASGAVALYLPAGLIGLALGAESDILAYFVRRYFGLRHYSSIYNHLLIAYYLGAIAGPLGIGFLSELAPYALAIACCMAAGTFALLPKAASISRSDLT